MGVTLSSKKAASIPFGVPCLYPSTIATTMTSMTLTSTPTTGIAAVGNVSWADQATHNISKIGVMTGNVTAGTGGVLRVSLQDVSAVTAPGQPDGTPDQSVSTSTMPSASTWTEYTLSSARNNVANGTMLAVALELTTVGTGVSIQLVGSQGGTVLGLGSRQSYAGSWSANAGFFSVALIADDGTIGWLNANNITTAINTHAFNSSSDPKALGNEYTIPYDVTIDSLCFQAIVADDLTVRVADQSGSTLASVTVLANQVSSKAAAKIYQCPITPTTISANTKFYVFVTPATTNNITLYSYDAATAAYMDAMSLGSYGKYTSISAANAIATATSTRRLVVWPSISAIGAPASVGGSGAIGSEGVSKN